jgi:hypothetical protein
MSGERGDAAPAEAIIVGADLAAGHDGEAELVLRILYPNGVVGSVLLDADAGYALMRNCNTESLGGLAGQSWRRVLEGI